MSQKCINVFFKDIKRKISYFGSFNEKTIKSNLKILYHIKEPIDHIFFTDENGEIMILEGDNVPNNLNVHLYIEYEPIPKEPEKELDILVSNTQNLVKFHWVFFDESVNAEEWKESISQNKYTYKAIKNNGKSNPFVVSSELFSNGKFFIVIRKGWTSFYSALCIINSEYKFQTNEYPYNCDEYKGIKAMDNYVQNIGILIDIPNHKVKFYDYCNHKLIIEEDINFQSAKLVAWLKGTHCDDGNGFTILNEGCIPVPDCDNWK